MGNMGEALFHAICRTGIFMICAQTVVHFRPQESYEKYLKLLVSVMVLVQLFLPIGSFFAGVNSREAYEQLDLFRESLEREMEEAGRIEDEREALLERMTLEEVRRLWQEQKEAEEAREKEEQTEEERAEEAQGASLPEETQTQEGLTREETREEEPEPSPGEIQVELEEMEPIVVEVGPIDALPADSGEKR